MDTLDADTEALLALILPAGPDAPRRELLDLAGGPAAVRALPREQWRRAGLMPAQIRALEGDPAALDPDLLARCRVWLRQPGHHLLGWHDPDYPPLLRRAGSPPPGLFVAGDPARLWHPAVAVVGSRGPTAGGRDNARAFARALAEAGFAVGSGLAAGVDRAAHEAALEVGGLTVAVLGTGPDVPYPREHAGLLARIAAEGAVVSEHPPGTGARREHFPSRNRILAGLSLGTLVIEAAQRSGALITARLAAETGREVFALPGTPENLKARGCHRLIRDGATLADDPAQVIEALATGTGGAIGRLRSALRGPHPSPSGTTAPLPFASVDDERVWQALGPDGAGFDELLQRAGLTTATLAPILLAMELDGRLTQQHGVYIPRGSAPHTRAGLQRRR